MTDGKPFTASQGVGSCNVRAHSCRNSLGSPCASVTQVSHSASAKEPVLAATGPSLWEQPQLFAQQSLKRSFAFSAFHRALKEEGDVGAQHPCSLFQILCQGCESGLNRRGQNGAGLRSSLANTSAVPQYLCRALTIIGQILRALLFLLCV